MPADAYIQRYLKEAAQISATLDADQIGGIVRMLGELREARGRLFVLGVGGSAANASHAVNDFRKICGIEAYTPTDNAAELTARVNDEGWETSFSKWLEVSRLGADDVVMVLSVGGGHVERGISMNIVRALDLARQVGARTCGVVGRDGGHTARVADACVVVPTMSDETVTPHTEAFQAVVWHLIVSHPSLRRNEMKWESTR